MIALDTNVLVRFLQRDDQSQSERARKLIERVIAEGSSIYLSDIVVCESVWVLTTSYRVQRSEVAEVLRNLLRAKHVTYDAPDLIARALDSFASGRGDFADYLIREHARDAGADHVATFDRALLKDEGFAEP